MKALDDPHNNGEAEAAPEARSGRGFFGRSPLTDPRSLGSSALFHALLILVASLAALRAVIPTTATPSRVVHAEIGPIDNRAPAKTGGGAPGALGGDTLPETFRVPADGRSNNSSAVHDPTADALLKDVLPAPVSPDAAMRALPGPLTSGVGVVPGPGSGGGGGSGGGSGGGVGRGIGPGTEFFGAREQGGSFAYVIDCSGSMSERRAIEVAKRELLSSLRQLPPDTKFGVVFYSHEISVFPDAQGKRALMPATSDNKDRVASRLSQVEATGGTDHVRALEAAFDLKPEVIFFLTDATQLPPEHVRMLVEDAGKIRIQAIEFGMGPAPVFNNPIQRLANGTHGQYRYIDVTSFPRVTP